jgi:hypothetical protein
MSALPGALRHRDYALLWGGQTVSVVGDGIYTIAIALATLLAGALVDRLPRRLVVLSADALRAGGVAHLAVSAGGNGGRLDQTRPAA